MKLSVCLIVKNEEKTLPRLMKCVKQFADEVVIVDTGSRDKTLEMIPFYADRMGHMAFEKDFSKVRNFSFSLASGDYLMWLDADDIIPDSSIQKLREWKTAPTDHDAVYLPYCTAFDESGKPTFVFERERIVKRSASPLWVGRVHETLSFQGSRCSLDIPIHHASEKTSYSTRNLDIYLEMEKDKESFSPRDMFYFGRELYYHKKYKEAISVLKTAASLPEIWIEDRISAFRFLALSYEGMGNVGEALGVLYSAFLFTPIRPDLACDIGRLLYARGNFRESIAWYRSSFLLPLPQNGFRDLSAIGYTPALGLCLAYDKLGELEKASRYNDLAGLFRPNSKAFLYNRSYFQAHGLEPTKDPWHILLSETIDLLHETM